VAGGRGGGGSVKGSQWGVCARRGWQWWHVILSNGVWKAHWTIPNSVGMCHARTATLPVAARGQPPPPPPTYNQVGPGPLQAADGVWQAVLRHLTQPSLHPLVGHHLQDTGWVGGWVGEGGASCGSKQQQRVRQHVSVWCVSGRMGMCAGLSAVRQESFCMYRSQPCWIVHNDHNPDLQTPAAMAAPGPPSRSCCPHLFAQGGGQVLLLGAPCKGAGAGGAAGGGQQLEVW
jgi:hypothetical protein